MDRLATLFDRFALQAHVFNTGALCQAYRYSKEDNLGYLHVLKEGKLSVTADQNEPKTLEGPSLVFFMRPSNHSIKPLGNDPAITVCGEIDFHTGLENPVVSILPQVVYHKLEPDGALQNIINLLFLEAFTEECGRQYSLNRICELLVVQLIRLTLTRNDQQVGLLAGLSDERLAKALMAIHKNPAGPWTIASLAMVAGMSRASFAEKFRSIVGLTVGDYLNLWRLGLAKNLLKQGSTVTQVAEEVGYGSAAAFARSFNARFGVSPTHWLRQASGN